jgi:hypothetical protein
LGRAGLRCELTVVADLSGVAGLAATSEDYLIPSSILNAVVSGLISRTVLHPAYVGPTDFHACVFYDHLFEYDVSRWFVDTVSEPIRRLLERRDAGRLDWAESRRAERKASSDGWLNRVAERYGVRDRNRIKPGIGEATRVLLRRIPDRLLLKQPDSPDLRHLVLLAEQNKVPIEQDASAPYRAAALIRDVGTGEAGTT